jgi:hypothetical protein
MPLLSALSPSHASITVLAAGITWIAGACANRVLKPRTFGVGKPDVNGERLPEDGKTPVSQVLLTIPAGLVTATPQKYD